LRLFYDEHYPNIPNSGLSLNARSPKKIFSPSCRYFPNPTVLCFWSAFCFNLKKAILQLSS
ncbi:MAG: hypothetical protein ACRC3B_07605, partial [Bacteroidia bacterium]